MSRKSDLMMLARVPGAAWSPVPRTQMVALMQATGEIEFQAAGDTTATIRRIVVVTLDSNGGYRLRFGFDLPGRRTISTRVSARTAALASADMQAYLASLETLRRAFGAESPSIEFDRSRTPKPSDGKIGILTRSGTTYEVDIDQMEIRRHPGRLAQTHATVPASQLRGDGQLIKLLEIAQLALGKPALFYLEPLGDPRVTVASTIRTTRALLLVRLTSAQAGTADIDPTGR
ncbi:MAG: hypothetical protein JWM49_2501 [Microbacteriaceae bacterium]|nr:hypothetical protein [Microbacteriaceae bacterium]